jgi:DNA repair protein RadA/Sms
VRLRAERLGLDRCTDPARCRDLSARHPDNAGLHAAPVLLVIDSIQTMHSDQIEGAPGTVSQVRGCAFELIRYAKENGVVLVLVGHVTKDGAIAGPRVLEHMVDVVMSFEGERSHQYRILRSLKNRFGPVDEIGVFAMAGQGLEEVGNPSMLFLSGRDQPVPGSAVFPGHGGHAAGSGRNPGTDRAPRQRRDAAPGGRWMDSGRLAMLLAVLEARCGLNFSSAEVYLNVAGGYRLADPAADLAVAAALVSALGERTLPENAVWFGEISLAGEVRPVAHSGIRQREAGKLGFSRAFGPAGSAQDEVGVRYVEIPLLRMSLTGFCRTHS